MFAEDPTRMTRLASTEYATDDRASDAKIGRARIFGSRVCSMRPLAMDRPTKMRLTTWVGEEDSRTLAIGS